jgi:hypothetical protein
MPSTILLAGWRELRNGHRAKTVLTEAGPVEIDVLRSSR